MFLYKTNKFKEKKNIFFTGVIESRFLCPQNCGRSYKNKSSINRHLQFECGVERKFECHVCFKRFTHKIHLANHLVTVHVIIPDTCKL